MHKNMYNKPLTNNNEINNWSSKVAYAIGLITTDGSLSSDGRHITFVSKDIDLMETFKRCLNLNNRITPKTSGYSDKIYNKIQFSNVNFYRMIRVFRVLSVNGIL